MGGDIYNVSTHSVNLNEWVDIIINTTPLSCTQTLKKKGITKTRTDNKIRNGKCMYTIILTAGHCSVLI